MRLEKNDIILLADDSKAMRNIIKAVLRAAGFKNPLLEADDGDQAISLLEDDVYKDRIKLVLCDWNMPNTTGLDVLRWMRESDYHKSLPFIMVTAEGMKKNIVDAIQAGVSSYIVKPFNPKTIEDKIQQVFNRIATASEY